MRTLDAVLCLGRAKVRSLPTLSAGILASHTTGTTEHCSLLCLSQQCLYMTARAAARLPAFQALHPPTLGRMTESRKRANLGVLFLTSVILFLSILEIGLLLRIV